MDFYGLKRNRLGLIQGQETVNQIEHCHAAGAKLVMSGVLVPGIVITTDPSSAPVLVHKGTILRIQTTAALYVAFDDTGALGSVSATTSPGLYLPASTISLVVATGDFLATSAAPTRIEALETV